MQLFTKGKLINNPEKRDLFIKAIMEKEGLNIDEATLIYDQEIAKNNKVWVNDIYTVYERETETYYNFPEMIWLSIKRNDRERIENHWSELQKIKNAIMGPEYEAVEIYPAESRLVNTANQYHLWVLKNPELRFPFGFNERYIATSEEAEKLQAKQSYP